MTNSPHSLNRNSLGSVQLPLPSGLNARPAPPTSPRAPQPISSSTHAGGIQPNASFFRPSRPSYQQQQYSRPASPSSLNHDTFQLAPLSDDRNSLADTMHDHDHQFTTLKRIKQSREPLLPGPGGAPQSSPQTSRPSMTRDRSDSASAPPRSATQRLVRNSLDRVLSISRGLSFDSVRKPAPHEEEPGHSPSTPASGYHLQNKLLNRALDVTRNSQSHYSQSHRNSGTSAPSAPSPEPSFIPTPPRSSPLPAYTPLLHLSTHKPIRRYEQHPSRNHFFFQGRILTGGDTPWAFFASFSLLLGVAGVWFATTGVWWWREGGKGGEAVVGVGLYMTLLTISTMLATATIDPGILPRGLDPDPPYPSTSPSDGGVRAPMPRDLKVRTDVVRVKYCPTCQTYRPPRSSHCKMCDNCVDGCDHHCQWVNNCIGRRNYTTFFALLVFATTTILLIILTSALHLYFLTQRGSPEGGHLSFRQALTAPGKGGVGSAVAFCLSIAVVWPVAALASYHVRLLFYNITTIEQIRNQAHKSLVPGPPPPNPFSHGNWRRNILAVLCRPRGHSWLDGSAVATEDKREINPGMLGEDGWEGRR